MKIFNIDEINKLNRNVSCIGYFDGVHLGHKALIEKTIYLAKEKKIESCVITFRPSELIKDNNLIIPFEKRIEIFEELGIDNVVVFEFNDELKNTEANEFVFKYLENMNIDTLVCGYDFKYGHLAKGNVKTLKENASFSLVVIDEVIIDNKKVSSSRIKDLIKQGDFKQANRLLGYELFK